MTLPLTYAKVPQHAGIDLRCCSCTEVDWAGLYADLVIADPPWMYSQKPGEGVHPEEHYACLTIEDIAAHMAEASKAAPLMALWLTWPLLGEWLAAWKKAPTTGGAWTKSGPGDTGHFGPGYWWAGCSEPVLLYSWGGGARDLDEPLRNAWIEAPGVHSRKPAAWMAQWIRRWVPPGGLVADPYAGLGSVAEAVLLAGEGRRYLGTEIDPGRHADALGLLAQVRGGGK